MKKYVIALLFLLLTPVTACNSHDAPSIEAAFSPEQGATALVVKSITEARHTIRLAAYSFTSKPIAEALVSAHKRGVDVRVVLDKRNKTARYSAAGYLSSRGVPTRIDSHYSIMHDKYIIIDDRSIELGSFNYTKAAEEHNAENVLYIHNDPAVAKIYDNNWQKLWEESHDY